MSKIKLLTFYFKVITSTLIILILTSCSINYLNSSKLKRYTDLVYVANIKDLRGMYLRNYLLNTFSKNNYVSAKYILYVNVGDISTSLQLPNIYGFATQTKIYMSISFELKLKSNDKVLVQSSSTYNGFYNTQNSSYANISNYNNIIRLLAKASAYDISVRVLAELRKYKGFTQDVKPLEQKK